MAMRGQDASDGLGRFRRGPIEQEVVPPEDLTPPKPRFRHEVPLKTATVSCDGKILVALDAEGSLVAWDAVTARRLYRRPALDRSPGPQRLAVSPDGRFLALSPWSLPAGPVRVCDLPTGKELRRFDRGFSAAFSPDGEILAATDGTLLRRWAMKSGAELPNVEESGAALKWTVWSPKGDLLAASAEDSPAVTVWDVGTSRRVPPDFSGTPGIAAEGLAFSPNGKILAVGDHWGIRFKRVGGGSDPDFFPHEEYALGQLRISADGRRMIASIRRRRLLVWDLLTGRHLFTWAAFLTEDGFLEVSEGGDIAIWIERGGIRLERIPRFLAGPEDGHVIRSFCFTPEGQVITGDDLGILRVWDPVTQKEVRRFQAPLERMRFLSRSGSWATFGGGTEPVRIWDLVAGREIFKVESTKVVSAVALSPDATTLGLGHSDGTVSLWDLATKKEIHRISPEMVRVTAIRWSADGKTLALGDDAGTVILAEGNRGLDPLRFRPRSDAGIRELSFSADGKSVLATDARGYRRSYTGELGSEPILIGNPGKDMFQCYLPDDRWNASGFLQKPWLHNRVGHDFSPDGSFAVTVTRSGAMLIWQAPGGK